MVNSFTSVQAFKDVTWAIKRSLPFKTKITDIRLAVAKSEGFHSVEAYMSALDSSPLLTSDVNGFVHPMQKAFDAIPNLTFFGVGLYNKGLDIAPHERPQAVEDGREKLKEEIVIFERVCKWLESIDKRQTINRNHTSYGLKHVVENQIDEYVSNGTFIAAAICSGFDFKLIDRSPNVFFNISEASLRKIDQKKQRIKQKKYSRSDNFRKLLTEGLNKVVKLSLIDLKSVEPVEGEIETQIFGKASIVKWSNAGFGELNFSVWWGVKDACLNSKGIMEPLNKNPKDAVDAFCTTWIEREQGAWIQGYKDDGLPSKYASRDAMDNLSMLEPPFPNGFSSTGRFMM